MRYLFLKNWRINCLNAEVTGFKVRALSIVTTLKKRCLIAANGNCTLLFFFLVHRFALQPVWSF